jgi:membrane-bound ClpP family serine protease
MWIVAGVLLGLVVVASIAGFHLGPHAHAAATVLGVVAAVWLVAMALDGDAAPLLWVLLTADVIVSGGLGLLAWHGRPSRVGTLPPSKAGSPEAAEGVAVSDLDPTGIVRVRGETWSAESVNGRVPAGSLVQVLAIEGVRLKVWGEEASDPGTPALFTRRELFANPGLDADVESATERRQP